MKVSPTELLLAGLATTTLQEDEAELLRRHRLPGVLLLRRNVQQAEQLQKLCADVDAVVTEATGLPALIAVDQEGGNVAPLAAVMSVAPAAWTLGCADDPPLTHRIHRMAGATARSLGINLLLAPVADVQRPGNLVIGSRAFGQETERVARHVVAAVEGLIAGQVACCAKHWPGHGSALADSHLTEAKIELSRADWERIDRLPFARAITSGCDAVMAAHLRAPALDPSGRIATLSTLILGHVLREELGFEGAILSDAVEMEGFGQADPLEALQAGVDLVLLARPLSLLAEELERMEKNLSREKVGQERLLVARARVQKLRARAAGGPPRSLARPGPGSFTTGAGDRVDATGHAAVFESAEQHSLHRIARLRGAQTHWPSSSSLPPWPPLQGGRMGQWVLIDAATTDRLLRPAQAAIALDLLPRPEAAERSALLDSLTRALGSAPLDQLLLPVASGEGFIEEALSRLHQVGPIEWIVLAALRPFGGRAATCLREAIARLHPRWALLFGDQSLAELLSPAVGWLSLAGAREEDIEAASELLHQGNR